MLILAFYYYLFIIFSQFFAEFCLFIMKSLIAHLEGDEGDMVCLYHATYSTNMQRELQSQGEATRLRWQNNAKKKKINAD